MLKLFALPCLLIILKQAFRTSVDEETKFIELLKALLGLPLDIVFMSLSFGSSRLIKNSASSYTQDQLALGLSGIIGVIVIGLVVTSLCKRSIRAFINETYITMFSWMFASYFTSIAILIASVYATEVM